MSRQVSRIRGRVLGGCLRSRLGSYRIQEKNKKGRAEDMEMEMERESLRAFDTLVSYTHESITDPPTRQVSKAACP